MNLETRNEFYFYCSIYLAVIVNYFLFLWSMVYELADACEFVFLQISMIECNYETGQLVIHLKGFNQRLCRKGLLERGISVGKWFGNFKSLENELMKKAAVPNSNVEDLLLELKKQKSNIVYIVY